MQFRTEHACLLLVGVLALTLLVGGRNHGVETRHATKSAQMSPFARTTFTSGFMVTAGSSRVRECLLSSTREVPTSLRTM